MSIRRLLLVAAAGVIVVAGVRVWRSPHPDTMQAQDAPHFVEGPRPPVVFAMHGNQTEIPAGSNGTVVRPSVAPPDLKGVVAINGAGAVHFEPEGGVWFTQNGQQRGTSAYLQFAGDAAIRQMFTTTGPGEVTVRLRSKYDFEERLQMMEAAKNRFGMRCAVDAWNESGSQLRIDVSPYSGHLAIMYRVGDTGKFFWLPEGKENEIYGKGKVMTLRLRWDGIDQAQLWVNGKLLESIPYVKSRAGWKNASFSIGAHDRREGGGGFWASDDSILDVEVRNAGPLPDKEAPEVRTDLAPQTEVSGTRWFPMTATDNERVSKTLLLVDGKEAGSATDYPYSFFVDTRKWSDGPHQLEFVALDAAGNRGKAAVSVNVKNAGIKDTEPPGPITGIGTQALLSTAVTLSWNAAADNVAVVRYTVQRNGTAVGEVPAGADATLTFADHGLSPGTTYSYEIAAVDAAGNVGSASAPLEITTRQQDGKILKVGPAQKFAKPCDAFKAAAPWDTVEIDAAGNYDGDVCVLTNSHLVIRGVNGRPRIDAIGFAAASMGTWVVNGTDVLVENVEMSGASVGDRNGAAIRMRGRDLVVRRVYFHHNQDGLLVTAPAAGSVTVEHSEFAFNGAGEGQSHNIYVGVPIDRFTMRYSYSHDATVGHLVKSRAKENWIVYNRLTDEGDRTSYEAEMPNGGISVLMGNLIEQAAKSENRNIVAYGLEKFPADFSKQFYVVYNTFLNRASFATFVLLAPQSAPAMIANNVVWGPGNLSAGAAARDISNVKVTAPTVFQDMARWDMRPKAGSPAAGHATRLQPENGRTLEPLYEYVHPTSARRRPPESLRDAGAFAAMH